MRAITEFLYALTNLLPPGLKDRAPLIHIRNRLRHWEILRRTSELVEKPYYREQIETRQFKVVFVSPIYKSFPLLAVSLIDQTYDNWELLFVHDGPSDELPAIARSIIDSDSRIRMIETEKRANDWGHSPRQKGFEELSKNREADFVVVTGSDNYHAPGYIEKMLEHFDEEICVAYCDMVHEYYKWRNFETRLEYSFIDCGCVMARVETALAAGLNDNSYEGDWRYVADLIDKCGTRAFRKVNATLYAHN